LDPLPKDAGLHRSSRATSPPLQQELIRLIGSEVLAENKATVRSAKSAPNALQLWSTIGSSILDEELSVRACGSAEFYPLRSSRLMQADVSGPGILRKAVWRREEARRSRCIELGEPRALRNICPLN